MGVFLKIISCAVRLIYVPRRASQLLRPRLSEGRACRPPNGGLLGNGAHLNKEWGGRRLWSFTKWSTPRCMGPRGAVRSGKARTSASPVCFRHFWPHGVPKTAMIAYETCAGVHALFVFYVTLHAVKRHKDVSFYHLQPQRCMFCPLLPASLCRNHGASTAHGQPFAAAHPHISTYIPCPCNTFAISAS